MTRSLWSVAVLAAIATPAHPQPGKGINRYSIAEEVSVGKQMARQFRADTTPLANAAVGDYVNRVGAALADQLPGFWPYRFEVIRENAGGPTLEPVAFPGGPIFISAELIATARSEAEFASMLAHAMVHVAERDWTRSATRGDLLRTGGQPPPPGAAAPVPLGMIQFQYSCELHADYLAVHATAAAGYDPEGLATYLERVQPLNGAVAKAFDPMPPRAQRVKFARNAIAKLPARTYQSGGEFLRVQAQIAQH